MIKLVPLTDIRIDGGTQPRCEIDANLVSEYVEAMENENKFPPVTVFFDGAHYWLADGFHRYHAEKLIGSSGIQCEIKGGTVRDAILYSVGANAEHGNRRTDADKRKAVLTLLRDEEWSSRPQTWIATTCGVSQPFVSRLAAAEPELSYNQHKIEREVVRGSSTYKQDTSNIGKSRGAKKEKNEPPTPPPIRSVTHAMHYAQIAKTNLQCIRLDDPKRLEALDFVLTWIESEKKSVNSTIKTTVKSRKAGK